MESTADLTTAPPELHEQAPPFKIPEIPPEVASAGQLLARLSVAARLAKREEARNNPPPEPEPIPDTLTESLEALPDNYPAQRLLRVREQLDRLDALMMTEKEPQKLDRLAAAQAKLSEQERILAGRPLPGSRRPGKERESKDRGEAHPV